MIVYTADVRRRQWHAQVTHGFGMCMLVGSNDEGDLIRLAENPKREHEFFYVSNWDLAKELIINHDSQTIVKIEFTYENLDYRTILARRTRETVIWPAEEKSRPRQAADDLACLNGPRRKRLRESTFVVRGPVADPPAAGVPGGYVPEQHRVDVTSSSESEDEPIPPHVDEPPTEVSGARATCRRQERRSLCSGCFRTGRHAGPSACLGIAAELLQFQYRHKLESEPACLGVLSQPFAREGRFLAGCWSFFLRRCRAPVLYLLYLHRLRRQTQARKLRAATCLMRGPLLYLRRLRRLRRQHQARVLRGSHARSRGGRSVWHRFGRVAPS